MDICATRNPLGCQGSACVEVMTTLHGSASSLRRHEEGCVSLEGMIASVRDPLKSTSLLFRVTLTLSIDIFSLGSASWIRIGGRLIKEAIASLDRRIDAYQTEVALALVTVPTPTSEDPHACMDRLEQRLRQLRTLDRVVTWDDFNELPMASLSAKLMMPKIERYTGLRPLRHYQTVGQTSGLYYPLSPHVQYRPRAPSWSYDQAYVPPALALPHHTAQGTERPLVSYSVTTQPCYAAQTQRQFSQLGMSLRQTLQKLTEARLLTARTPRPPPQLVLPQFKMDLQCVYHQGLGHETDCCTALRHTIQDLIDQGVVHLGQPSVTTNLLLAHTTHAVPPPTDSMHSIDFAELDDHIHMLSWDESKLEPIVSDEIYEIGKVILGPRMSTPFRLVPVAASVQTATVEPSTFPHYRVEWYNSSSPVAARPLEMTSSQEEVKREDDEILMHPIIETTTTPEGLIHMVKAGRATCIVFSDDDLPPDGLDHTCPLYISVGCSGRRVPSVVLDNGSALNISPLATAITLGYEPFDFGPSTQTIQAYDSSRREVMGTLEIELLIGLTTFPTLFQVLRIPTSFNLLLGQPWIHRVGAIHSSLHQKVKFILDGRVITVQSVGDMFISSKPVLQISHSDDDLFMTGFTFDEVQTLEMKDFCRDFVTMSFDEHDSTVVLNMMRSMSYLLGMGWGDVNTGPVSS
ncbi:hypothetical protein CK203_059830 [Vitis vinifera]|uniref:Uncharacterized protein n=1 Tax=Vitis vinifera TaxID=29760 RepID=A0A438GG35_VITVI|nr:hypothetical protein CK203_059830 [Vitis vinifera]